MNVLNYNNIRQTLKSETATARRLLSSKALQVLAAGAAVWFLLAGIDAIRRNALESRAETAFENQRYSEAIPLYRDLAGWIGSNSQHAAAALDRLKQCQAKLAAAHPAQTMPVYIPQANRIPHAAPKPGEVRILAIRALGNFVYDPDLGGIPDDVKPLDGMMIQTTGYMLPLDQSEKMTDYVLVPSLTSCCFGQPPTVQHIITVHGRQSIGYFDQPITVRGKLRVREKRDDGYTVSIFELDDAVMVGLASKAP